MLAAAMAARSDVAAAPSPPPRQQPPPTEPASSQTGRAEPDDSTRARAEAEPLYAKGYQEVDEAKKDDSAGKADAARKKFGKALKKFQDAVDRDPRYYEAWNMVGYCARKTGDLKRAFAAYQTCLSINPEYEEAHEYLGEAYVQAGDLAKAKAELAWLRSRDSEEADELAAIIAAAQGKAGAPADSTQRH